MRFDTYTTSELRQLSSRADTLRIMAGDDLTRRFIKTVSDAIDAETLTREGQQQLTELRG